MKKIFDFQEYLTEMENANLTPSFSPINYNCPNCGIDIDFANIKPYTNPIPCEGCGETFEYPWASNSWRWS
jgi:predicted RNA-binding Zn-ribbon protein involved in translation (DUF1610 family)